jgi:hypothetical protein
VCSPQLFHKVVVGAEKRHVAAADIREAIQEVTRRCGHLDQELQDLKAMKHAPVNEQVSERCAGE